MTIGAGLILWNKLNISSLPFHLLIAKPVELVGLCSYSLHLWHWPILVFLEHIYVDSAPLDILIGALLVTILISYLSWRYIENPFRNGASIKATLYAIIISYILLAVYATTILALKGLLDRNTALANSITSAIDSNYRCPPISHQLDGASRGRLISDTKDTPSLALSGNSHAQMYAPALIESLNRHHETGLITPLNGCLPTIDLNISIECIKMAEINF